MIKIIKSKDSLFIESVEKGLLKLVIDIYNENKK